MKLRKILNESSTPYKYKIIKSNAKGHSSELIAKIKTDQKISINGRESYTVVEIKVFYNKNDESLLVKINFQNIDSHYQANKLVKTIKDILVDFKHELNQKGYKVKSVHFKIEGNEAYALRNPSRSNKMEKIYRASVKKYFPFANFRVFEHNSILEFATIIKENIRQAKELIQTGKITKSDLNAFKEIDPTSANKYVGWMAKTYATDKDKSDFDYNKFMETLKGAIEKYHEYSELDRTLTTDLYRFKHLETLVKDLKYLDTISEFLVNSIDLEDDINTLIDDEDLLVIAPHTHAASRKLGFTDFKYRVCGYDDDGNPNRWDSTWCTTYASPSYWNNYFYDQDQTLIYVKIRNEEVREKVVKEFGTEHVVVFAIQVYPNGRYQGSDGENAQYNDEQVRKFISLLNIDLNS